MEPVHVTYFADHQRPGDSLEAEIDQEEVDIRTFILTKGTMNGKGKTTIRWLLPSRSGGPRKSFYVRVMGHRDQPQQADDPPSQPHQVPLPRLHQLRAQRHRSHRALAGDEIPSTGVLVHQ